MREIVALVEQRLSVEFGARIRETVAEIQRGAVAGFAEAVVGRKGARAHGGGHVDNCDAGQNKEIFHASFGRSDIQAQIAQVVMYRLRKFFG